MAFPATFPSACRTCASGFNRSQADYEIVCVSQDNYDNTLQNTIAAFRANKQPTVTQIFDAGTLDLMLSGAYMPVRQLMADERLPNRLEQLPLGYRVLLLDLDRRAAVDAVQLPRPPCIYYNTDALAKVGFEGTAPDLGRSRRPSPAP